MLYALGDPLSFVLLVGSYLIAVTAHGWLACLAADRAGDRQPRLEGRLRPDPRRHLDPFGTVAGLIAGFGWARPLEPAAPRQRTALLAGALTGPAINLLLAVMGLLAFRALSGTGVVAVAATVLQHGLPVGPVGQRAALLFGLMNAYVAILSLLPLPPLDGGRLLFALGPRSAGWQKAHHYLVEQNIGLAVLLVLLLLPLGGPQALLPTLVDTLVSPLVRLATGG